ESGPGRNPGHGLRGNRSGSVPRLQSLLATLPVKEKARSRGLFRFRPTLNENVLGPGNEPVARGRPVSAAVSAAVSPAALAEFFPRVAGRRAGRRRSADLARRARCHGRILRILACAGALADRL